MSKVSKHEIAKMIDHSLLHPTMDDQTLKEGIELAKQYDVASVCIKPYAVKMAAEMLAGIGCDGLHRHWISARKQQGGCESF